MSTTIKGSVIEEIRAGYPEGKLKSIEYGSFGNIVKIEWYEPEADDEGALAGGTEYPERPLSEAGQQEDYGIDDV